MYNQKQMIQGVISTLNMITVKGKDNLDMLLGCIIALEALIKEEDKNDGNSDAENNI